MKGKGFSLFQTGTGWALESRLEKNGNEIAKQTIFQSDVFIGDDEKIVLQFVDFYPDFVLHNGEAFTKTPFPKNPRMLFSLYHNGQQVMMNVAAPGQPIKFLNYTFHIESPQLFTALQVVSDPGTPLVFLGGLLLLVGIFLSFYWVPQELYGFTGTNGQGWIAAYARRNQTLFYESLDQKLESKSLEVTNG
jgi:cytochrome c biogenesis protein